MKVIFLEDVSGVATAGQTKVVADGYARNYLLPRKLAVLADSQASAAVEAYLKKLTKRRTLEEAEMAELAKKISGVEITLKAKVGENEKLYGSVTGADIAEALSKATGCEIDKRKIELAEPIKQAGGCDVTIRFTHDIMAVIKVNVMSDEAVEEKPKKKSTAKSDEAAEEKPVKPEKKAKVKSGEVAEEKPAKAEKKTKAKATKKAEDTEVKAEKAEKKAARAKKKETEPGE